MSTPTMDAPAMRAIVQRGYGDPEHVLHMTDVARPEVGPDDVLVRVKGTSVNTPDWSTITGRPLLLRLTYGLMSPSTAVRGTDVAGVVEAIGAEVTSLKPGDEVFGSLWDKVKPTASGTFAEFVVAPADQLFPKPATVSFTHAGSSVMSGLTALAAMRDVGGVGPGTTVLINGASGGVGSFAVQIAKASGAEVTGVCSSRNVELVRSLGADHVIDYTKTKLTAMARGYDVVLDNVMNHSPVEAARMLSPTGVFIPNSLGHGKWLAGLPRMGRAALMGRGSTRVGFVTCVVNQHNLAELSRLLESGAVRVHVDREFQLADTAAAVTHMLSRRARGKLAITV